MPKPLKNYAKEFKEQAVDLLLSSDRPLVEVARELGITPASLRSWRNRRWAEGPAKNSAQIQGP